LNEGPDIQHKPPFKAESDFGFENDGRVPITGPDIFPDDPPDADTPASAAKLLDSLLLGTSDLSKIGARVVILAYCDRRCQRRPKSFRELGDWLGCSHTAARQKVSTFFRIIKGEIED
jgi:hypothetical protein